MKRLFLLPFLILMGGWVAPARAQQTSTITASGSDCTTAGACVISGLDTNAASVAFTLSGTWSGTVQFTGSTLTSGSNPAAVNCQPPNSTSAVTSATANGTWTCAVAGLRWFALRASTLSSGTVNVVLNTSPAISAALLSGGGGGGGSGTVTSVSCVSGCTITNPTTTPAITVTAGGGNVTGPGTSVVNDVATYANTSGTVLLDGGGPLPASLANSSHKWLNSYTLSTGLFTQTQPAISDLTATFSSPLSLSTNTLSCPTCVTSAASLTQYGVVIGGGLQASSTIPAAATTTFALFATATSPAFRAIAPGDLPTAIPIGNIGSAGLSGTSPIAIASTGAISCSTCNTSSATVTSVGGSFTGGLISVAGSPVTSSGTLALTVAGTSGGIPYFSSTSTWASSALLPTGDFVLGGGAGSSPTATFSIIPVANGGTNLASGTSGGVLCYTATGTLASSGALTVNVLPKGGGAGACPTNSSVTDNGTTVSTTEPIVTTSTVSTGTSPPSATAGTGFAAVGTEGTIPSVGPASGVDVLWWDSSLHCVHANFNNVDVGCLQVTKTLSTATNCSSSASPAVCASAAAGSVALPTNAVSSSIVVNTTAVTANSDIFAFTDDTLGTKLGVTCNSTVATLVGGLTISARTAGTSFTIANNVAVVTNPLCVSYLVVN